MGHVHGCLLYVLILKQSVKDTKTWSLQTAKDLTKLYEPYVTRTFQILPTKWHILLDKLCASRIFILITIIQY